MKKTAKRIEQIFVANVAGEIDKQKRALRCRYETLPQDIKNKITRVRKGRGCTYHIQTATGIVVGRLNDLAWAAAELTLCEFLEA